MSSYLRQRKDDHGENGYSCRMNAELALHETTVAVFLEQTPKAVRFFINQRTACVGCHLAKFCTLKDVVTSYRLDEETFIREIAKLTVHTL